MTHVPPHVGCVYCEHEFAWMGNDGKMWHAGGVLCLLAWTWLRFGDVSRKLIGMQSQYASQYIDGRHGKPNFGDGLQFRKLPAPGNAHSYHDIEIHKDDFHEFVRRVQEWRKEKGQI